MSEGNGGKGRARGRARGKSAPLASGGQSVPPSASAWPSLGAGAAPQQAAPQPGPTPTGGAWGGAVPPSGASGRARSHAVAPPPSTEPPKPIVAPQVRAGDPPRGGPPGQTGIGEVVSSFRGISISEGRPQAQARRGAKRGRMDVEPPVVTRPPDISAKKGTMGKQIFVEANYFKLSQTTDWSLYQYRVDFSPDEDRTHVRKAILRAHKKSDPLNLGDAYIFDGSMLFTIRRLHPDLQKNIEFMVTRTSDNSPIKITIKFTNEMAIGDFTYIQLFNIILRNCMDLLKFQLVNREYFDPTKKHSLRNYRLELWPGYVTSILQHDAGILMGLDVAHKVLRTDTVLDMINEVRRREGDKWQEVFHNSILGQVVFTHYNNKPYRVDDVVFNQNPESTFKKGDQDIKYMDYYKTKYNVFIQNRQQPLLLSRPKQKDIRGGRNQDTLLIPELCNMTGLSDEMRANFSLMKAVSEKTRVPPGERIEKYYEFIKRISTSPEAKSHLQTWNIRFENRLEEISGRILPDERLQLHRDNKQIEVREGDWTRDMRGGLRMFHQVELKDWVLIYPYTAERNIDQFLQSLKRAADSIGYPMNPPEKVRLREERSSEYAQAIDQSLSKRQFQLVLVIINHNKADLYTLVKKKTLIERSGVASQVVLTKTLGHKNLLSIATKIVIQLNCKLGGAPWFCNIPFKEPTMVIGFDVCHDGGGGTGKKRSYGAMVASTDANMTRWYSVVLDHEHGSEFFDSLSFHVLTACQRFAQNTRVLPKRIIIYRDGVGESNVPLLLNHEVKQIEDVLRKLYKEQANSTFLMAFVVVSKRIQTRIFVRGNNPSPGTIVDDVITRPERYDFYLVSQSVKQGTVTPTNYNVIYDNTKMTPDQLQRITYKMTHMYFNCSSTVRVPATVQYAHKLAFLVGQSLRRLPEKQFDSDVLYYL